jgi:hypothetical protein
MLSLPDFWDPSYPSFLSPLDSELDDGPGWRFDDSDLNRESEQIIHKLSSLLRASPLDTLWGSAQLCRQLDLPQTLLIKPWSGLHLKPHYNFHSIFNNDLKEKKADFI